MDTGKVVEVRFQRGVVLTDVDFKIFSSHFELFFSIDLCGFEMYFCLDGQFKSLDPKAT